MGYMKDRWIEQMEPKEMPPMEPNTTDTDAVDHLRWLANSATPMDAAAMRLAADEIERLRTAIRRIAEQDGTLAIVNGVIYVDDDEVCAIGHQEGRDG